MIRPDMHLCRFSLNGSLRQVCDNCGYLLPKQTEGNGKINEHSVESTTLLKKLGFLCNMNCL